MSYSYECKIYIYIYVCVCVYVNTDFGDAVFALKRVRLPTIAWYVFRIIYHCSIRRGPGGERILDVPRGTDLETLGIRRGV
jgi:hypothetical protein